MTVVVVLTTAFAAVFVIGMPTLFIVRAVDAGMSAWRGVLWGALAVVSVGGILQAVVRDAQTRGWLVVGLVGWIFYLVTALRRGTAGLIRR